MKFPRSKQIVFANNKGGVGKTTLAFHAAHYFAEQGYKTVLVDLDPQCNLSLFSFGTHRYADTLFSQNLLTIYDVIKGIVQWGADIDLNIKPFPLKENLSIILGDIRLSSVESQLTTAGSFNLAASGDRKWYFETSMIYRYLKALWLNEQVDLFIIDTWPSLGALNRMIFLGADYFVVPLRTDAFSVQGIENLGEILTWRKRNREITAKALAVENKIDFGSVLPADPLFLGYVVNSFNVYNDQPIATHRNRIAEIPGKVQINLSNKLCKNGLVELSWQQPLGSIQDLWKAGSISQEDAKPVFDYPTGYFKAEWTEQVIEQAKQEFEELYRHIRERIEKW